MHRKGAQDARRAKIFTKIIRELTVAARTGLPDPHTNPRLRAAMIAARDANMPKDTIERAIKRGAGGEDTTHYEEVRYEGFGPGGIAIIVEALTDNRNRTASEIRTAFSKAGGNLGETNSVSYLFDQMGIIKYPIKTASSDAMLEAAIESGADNVSSDEAVHEISASPADFGAIRDVLEGKFGEAQESKLEWRAKSLIPVNVDTAESILKLIDALEDNDDVQHVYANYDLSEEIMAKLSAKS